MPLIVDGVQRRADVVFAATELVVRGGIGALTFRNLAEALGCSTTVISHYFRDKNDLLAETYRDVTARSMARRDRALAASGGDLLAALEQLLPADEEQRRHWVVWLAFWHAALFDAALFEEHRRGLAGTRERVRDHLAAVGRAEALQGAQAVCNALFGISVQALFDPAFWTPERQRESFRAAREQALAGWAMNPTG